MVGDNKQIINKVNTENDKEEGKKQNPIKQTKITVSVVYLMEIKKTPKNNGKWLMENEWKNKHREGTDPFFTFLFPNRAKKIGRNFFFEKIYYNFWIYSMWHDDDHLVKIIVSPKTKR